MSTIADQVFNVGLLAYGMSGKVFHAPFFQANAGFNLYAVTERNTKKANEVYPQVISYNTIVDLLADTKIDLVVINTPNNLHFEHAKAALQSGKHILVEKPFVANVAQAKELFALADNLGKQIFFYQNRRWDSDFLAVKKILQEKKLGKLVEMHVRYDRYRNVIGPKAFKEQAIEASGLLYDLGPHLLDQVISLFGKPLHFTKTTTKNRKGTLVDDYFSIQLNFPDDITVFVTATMLSLNPQPAFVLHGTEGSLIKPRADVQEEQLLGGMKIGDSGYGVEAQGMQGKLTTISENGTIKTEDVYSQIGTYTPLFDAIYATLVGRKPYPVTRDQVLTQLEIIES
ncbi:Gfo/Idh/MocA family oxidoreductase [Pedobacter sp. AW1-32]|uniref:Gfo/Idh/MocA family oxidoreductase n=1 Tax=Pedobacter sp. AW1-32 TaxID=3383026 RepID=UPI003FEF791C